MDNRLGHAVLPGVVARPEPYWERLRRLRKEADLSQPELYRRADGVGFDTIRALEKPYEDQRDGRKNRSRYPSADVLAKLADALGVEPEQFPEYKLAKARDLLDERKAGLEDAVTYLEQITVALRRRAPERSATSTRQQAERRRKQRATPDEDQTQEGGG